MCIVHFAAIDLVSTVIGDQQMHLDLLKEFIECGKLKQARRIVEVHIHSCSVNCYVVPNMHLNIRQSVKSSVCKSPLKQESVLPGIQ